MAWRAVIAAALLGGSIEHATSARAQPEPVLTYLREELGFSTSELRDLAQGRVALHSYDVSDGREIALAGAIRVPLSPAQYIGQLRDIVEFKRHEAVRQIGTFGLDPSVQDVAGLTLDPDHLEDLRNCRPRDCDFQLSSDAIGRFSSVPWRTPNAGSEADRILREILTTMVAGYRRRGDAALMIYENDRASISTAAEFQSMVAAAPALLPRFPVLEQHVRTPSTGSNDIEDILYWSKEDVGPKVIISVTHMAIHRLRSSGPVAYVAASKQLYGSHYFDASLGMTLLLADDRPSSSVLVYINRSRVDALSGFLGGLKRAIVRSRARSALADTLVRVRTRLPARVQPK